MFVCFDIVKVLWGSDGVLCYCWLENGMSYDLIEDDVFYICGLGGDVLGGFLMFIFVWFIFFFVMVVNVMVVVMFKNGFWLFGVFFFVEWFLDENCEIVWIYMVEGFMGVVNIGKFIVVEGGVMWSSFSIMLEDVQMFELCGFLIEEICWFFGVLFVMIQYSLVMISWFIGVEQQVLLFQKFIFCWCLKWIEMVLEKQFFVLVDRVKGVWIEFNFEGLLCGDSVGRVVFYKFGLNDGWFMINEVCGKENLLFVDGGDVLCIQKQNVLILVL